MCGFSGLPKFRQLVRPSGSAPTQARFARALEHGLDRAAVRVGGDAPAVAVDRDRDRGPRAVDRRPDRARSAGPGRASGACSTAASACSGRRTVREPTSASYCSKAHLREATLEEPSSATSDLARVLGGKQHRRRRVQRRGGLGRLEVVGRALVDQRGRPACRRPASPSSKTRRRRVSVTLPIAVPSTSQLARRRPAPPGAWPARRRRASAPATRETMISNGSMSASRSGTLRTSRSSPTSPLAAISADEEVRPGGAEVLQRDQQPAVQQLQRALEQLLLGERVADLHGRALVLGVVELGARPAPTRRRSRRGRSWRRTGRRCSRCPRPR